MTADHFGEGLLRLRGFYYALVALLNTRRPVPMTLRRLLLLVPTLVLCVLSAAAQTPPVDRTMFVKSRLSLTQYTGDNSAPLLSTSCVNNALGCDQASYGGGMEVGLQFTPVIGASVSYQTAAYPSISALSTAPSFYTQSYRVRRTVQVLTQYGFPDLFPRLTPYLQTGLHVTAGRTPLQQALPLTSGLPRTVERWAFGPSFSAGIDLAINRQLSVFAEATTSMTFPDDAVDGVGGFFGTDRLSWAGFGLKVKNIQLPARLFGPRADPSDVLAASAPSTLTVDEVGMFAVESEAASKIRPQVFQWAFDDGTTRHGRFVTRQFAEPGTYDVTLRRTDREEAVHTFQVHVRPPTTPTRIEAITVPDSARPGVPLVFHAETSGPTPHIYRWDLGDGTVAFTPEPSHIYAAPGTYTVALEVRSAADTTADTTAHTRTITVHDPKAATSAYFVQLGAFSHRTRAERYAHRHADHLPAAPVIHHDAGYYRVLLGFDTALEARHAMQRFRQTEAFAGAFLHTPGAETSPPFPVALQQGRP